MRGQLVCRRRIRFPIYYWVIGLKRIDANRARRTDARAFQPILSTKAFTSAINALLVTCSLKKAPTIGGEF